MLAAAGGYEARLLLEEGGFCGSTRLPHRRSCGGFPVRRRVIGKPRLEGQVAFVNSAEAQCCGFLCLTFPKTDEHENGEGSQRKRARAKENTTND
jgi:hypothetical protein